MRGGGEALQSRPDVTGKVPGVTSPEKGVPDGVPLSKVDVQMPTTPSVPPDEAT